MSGSRLERGWLKRQMKNATTDWEAVPYWFRKEENPGLCSQGHAFVNALSKFCHICGERRDPA